MSFPSTSSPSRPRLSPFGVLVGTTAILLLAWLGSRSSLSRGSVEHIPAEPFNHVYVQAQIGEPSKCLVTDRAGATLRRSEPETAGARWKCTWLQGPDGPVLIALTGKEPSYLFVPQAAVADPILPLVYEKVRRQEELPLPRLRWVHLFYDRTYRGFYLQVRLPDKKWTAQKELGRAEILETVDQRAWCWNRKLRSVCAMWNEAFIAEAIFPQPATSPGLDLLGALLDAGRSERRQGRSFILGETPIDAHYLWPWPLPFDMHRQLAGADGARRDPDGVGSGLSYSDARYGSWVAAPEAGSVDWRGRLEALVGAPQESDPKAADFERAAAVTVQVGAAAASDDGMAERLAASPAASWLAGGES